jgi:hypothetical protein
MLVQKQQHLVIDRREDVIEQKAYAYPAFGRFQ